MILVCGETLYDVFVSDEHDRGFGLDARLGGSAFNVAMGLGRLERSVGLLTAVGNDPLGNKIVATLEREGVTTRYLARPHLPTTLALVTLDATGSARYAFYGENAADRSVTTADLPALDGVAALVFGCFSLLTEPTGTSFLELARRTAGGPVVALDPNIRTTFEPDLDRWRGRVGTFAAAADLIKISTEDLALLHPDADAATVARDWLDGGTALVVLTAGGEGARAWFKGGEIDVPAATVDVVDTVGAGDSFLAALLAGLDETAALSRSAIRALEAHDVERLVRFAASAAAHTCARRGADLPRRADLGAL